MATQYYLGYGKPLTQNYLVWKGLNALQELALWAAWLSKGVNLLPFRVFFYVAGAGAPEHKAPRPQTVELPENPSYEDTDTDISPEEAQMVGNCVFVCVCVCL